MTDTPTRDRDPQRGDVYRSCDPRGGPTVRVADVDERYVHVVDAATGGRPRRILRTALHSTATTRTGQPRRTGYTRQENR